MSLQLLPIALGDISPSPTNPRRTFDPDYINELAIEHGNDVCDEGPFAIVETALEAAPKGRRALKKKEAAS